MIRGITDKGDIKTAKMTEDGELIVVMGGEGEEIEFPTEIEINNTSSNPIPTNITNEGIGINNTSNNPVPVNITNAGVGINNTSSNPKAIFGDLSNYSGDNLEPVISLRNSIELQPGESKNIYMIVGFGRSREQIMDIVRSYGY